MFEAFPSTVSDAICKVHGGARAKFRVKKVHGPVECGWWLVTFIGVFYWIIFARIPNFMGREVSSYTRYTKILGVWFVDICVICRFIGSHCFFKLDWNYTHNLRTCFCLSMKSCQLGKTKLVFCLDSLELTLHDVEPLVSIESAVSKSTWGWSDGLVSDEMLRNRMKFYKRLC